MKVVLGLVAVAAMGLVSSAQAAITYDTDLTEVNFTEANPLNDDAVIFGTGNSNGHFAVGRDSTGNFEVGLRAKIPYTNSPLLINAGTNTYSVATNTIWNFDWAVNTNVYGGGGALGNYTYEFVLDYYTVADGRQTFRYDPISLPDQVLYPGLFPDNALGDNTTTENSRSTGNRAADATNYASLLTTLNVAQNSRRLNWDPPFTVYDITEDATYHIALSILDSTGTSTITSSDIWVIVGDGAPVVPIPGAAGLGLLGLGLVAVRRRFSKTA